MAIRGRQALLPRVLGMAAALGLLVAFAPATAHAAPASATCQSIALPTPEGTTYSTVYGGDPTGRYLVGSGGGQGLLWVDGRLVPIDQSSLAPDILVQFNAVNRHGVFVGERMTDPNSFHTDAFVYHDGHFTMLPAPGAGDETHAVAINSRGDIVGSAFGATGWQAVEWPADRPGTVKVLTTPSGATGLANGIDEDGTVVGYLNPWPPGTPYVWPAHGPAHPLPVPAGSVGGNAVAIQNGFVAGNVFDPVSGSTDAAEWNLRTGTLTMRPATGAVTSVNRWGTLGLAYSIMHADGRVVPVSGWVYTVSDRGTAAGTTNYWSGQAELWVGC
jgi:uncharacterized membrane protein